MRSSPELVCCDMSFSLRILVASIWLLSCVGLTSAEEVRPNFLIVMADDCTYNDLPMYGGQNAKTPNLEKLAREGMTFDRAFLAEAICQPCRAELYSGLYPMSNGCNWNHSASRGDIESMPQHLGREGYRVGLAGKVHVSPRKAFPFEMVDGCDKNCVRNPTREMKLDSIAEFINRSNERFCLVVALVEPHVPWVMGDASAYPPDELKLPPNIGDTQETREAFSRYLAEITYMDQQFGQIMEVLEESGKADDTVVIFTSEQGSQFPGNKWTNYNTGVHTGLIMRWPGRIRANTRTDALVQYADVLPTMIDLSGSVSIDQPKFDGRSFEQVCRSEVMAHREYAYGTHNNVPEGPPYPIRSITDGRYHYIRNLQNENLYIEKHLMGIKGNGELNNKYWQTWVFECFDQPELLRLIQRYQLRPKEELYDIANDPYEMTNLIEQDELAEVRNRLSNELDRWLQSQGDPGIPQDTPESLRAAKQGRHRFGNHP
ncbi:sulfatase family protein [Rhodopirellula halodulae]|uniref:sulfatase family protein n=1 Tax=Rhodopirellula halodulae TaxID=2894198 RepID=UPI002104DD58|nr:sulfatase [Rhodopirellula sp. JC737]